MSPRLDREFVPLTVGERGVPSGKPRICLAGVTQRDIPLAEPRLCSAERISVKCFFGWTEGLHRWDEPAEWILG